MKYNKNGDVSLELKEEIRKNEKQTNIIIAIISVSFMALISIINILSSYLEFSPILDVSTHKLFLPCCVAFLTGDGIAWYFKFDRPWIKYMLVGLFSVFSAVVFFVFTQYSSYFLLVPILLAARYYNKKFLTVFSLITFLLFLLLCFLSLHFERTNDIIQQLHYWSSYNPWTDAFDVVVYIIVPIGIVLLLESVYCVKLSDSGSYLLKSRAENSKRISNVNYELAMASEIQKSVLPEREYIVKNGNFVVSAEELSAKEVAGDFYDYFIVGENILVVLVADVSDKGVPSAMFMMSAKKAIQCAIKCCHNLSDAIALANNLICSDNSSDMFLTVWLGLIDTSSGEGKFINAGHPSPILKHDDGNTEWIQNEPDLFLGAFPDRNPRINYFTMNPGDTLLIYTDGVTDAVNESDDRFGSERLFGIVKSARSDAHEMKNSVINEIKSFSKNIEQFDDITVLALHCEKTDKPTEIKTKIKADYEAADDFIDEIEKLLIKYGCPDDIRRNVDVVIDEVCTNITDYAYDFNDDAEDGEKLIDIVCEVGSSFVTLTFADAGKPFNPIEQDNPVFADEPNIGGLGIYLLKELSDKVEYEYVNGKNELTVKMIWGI